MKKLYVAQAIGVILLFTLCLWKNGISYKLKPTRWRVWKSLADTTVICLSALLFPPLLVGWAVLWLTRGLRTRALQVSLAIALGITFGVVSGVALEVLCLLSVFSVDLLTGAQGLYGWITKPIPDDFLPSWSRE